MKEEDGPLKAKSIVNGEEVDGSTTSFVDDVARKTVAKKAHSRRS